MKHSYQLNLLCMWAATSRNSKMQFLPESSAERSRPGINQTVSRAVRRKGYREPDRETISCNTFWIHFVTKIIA